MTPTPPPDVLAEQLPGRWIIRATNFPMWIRGDRRHPVIEYGLLTSEPLVLSDHVEYVDERRGDRMITGRDRYLDRGEHSGFVCGEPARSRCSAAGGGSPDSTATCWRSDSSGRC